MRKLPIFLSALCMTAALTIPASALDYTIDAPSGPEYGTPTSIEPVVTADRGETPNVDVSKNAALIPPTFGSPTSYLLNSGEYLTPDLAPGGMAVSEGFINGSDADIVAPDVPMVAADRVSISSPVNSMISSSADVSTGYTEVTSDLYYSGGYLAILQIPSLGVNVKVYEGTDSTQLAKGAGHFTDTSIWSGNVAIAGHNRGTNCYFGQIHTLNVGDTITLTTKLGTRTYAVTSVSKINETDRSGLVASSENKITLYTCVRDQSAYRWCVTATEVV
jgi:sortase A